MITIINEHDDNYLIEDFDLIGDFDLIKIISEQRPKEKQLIKDLKFLHKQIVSRGWGSYLNGYADYQANLHHFLNCNTFIITRYEGFYNKSIGGGVHIQKANIDSDEFINALENFAIKDGKKPACILRIMKTLDESFIDDIFEELYLKQFQKDIEKAKAKCIKKFKEKGAFENFGEKEMMELSDKWEFEICAINYATFHKSLVEFSDWAGSYNGN